MGYLVDDQAVWRLDSGATTAERITPPGVKVTSFDVWPGDGRIAYGTETGELYVVMPGQEPRLFHEAGSWRGRPFVIKSTAWSPNGARLAYSVDHATPDFIDHPDYANPTGLWLLALEGETRAQLLRNGYLTYDAEDVSDLRVISDVIWSPDGHALILETRHWEWHDVFLFFPVASSLDEANLHDPEGLAWKYGGWMRDSQSFLLSGTAYSHWCDLALVRRETRAYETLIVGTSENMCVEHAQELPSGIVFVAQCWSCEPRGVRFYIGHQTEEGFSYKQIGPAGGLCSPTDIKWDETGNLATLLCGRSIPLVSLDSGEIVRIDPIAFLGPLADLDYTDVKVAWGMAGE